MNILQRLLGVSKPQKIKTKTIKLGQIGVDSGTMMFCDPCYVIKNKHERWNVPEWKQFLPTLDNALDGGERNGSVVKLSKKDFSNGVVMNTGFGDGAYEVEIEEGDFGKFGKRVVSAKITFIQPEELEEKMDMFSKCDKPNLQKMVVDLQIPYTKFGNVLGKEVA